MQLSHQGRITWLGMSFNYYIPEAHMSISLMPWLKTNLPPIWRYRVKMHNWLMMHWDNTTNNAWKVDTQWMTRTAQHRERKVRTNQRHKKRRDEGLRQGRWSGLVIKHLKRTRQGDPLCRSALWVRGGGREGGDNNPIRGCTVQETVLHIKYVGWRNTV